MLMGLLVKFGVANMMMQVEEVEPWDEVSSLHYVEDGPLDFETGV